MIFQPSYNICVYAGGDDYGSYGSRLIKQQGYWEKDIGMMIRTLLKTSMNEDAIFLDIGANIGIHALYAAKLGFNVWAVEPQGRNLDKVSRYWLFIENIFYFNNDIQLNVLNFYFRLCIA